MHLWRRFSLSALLWFIRTLRARYFLFCRISIILVQSWQDAQEMTENKIYGKREWHKGKIIRYMGKGNSTFHKRWPKIRYMGKRNGSRGNSTFLKNAISRFFTSFVWTPLTLVLFGLISTRVDVFFRYSKESRLHLFQISSVKGHEMLSDNKRPNLTKSLHLLLLLLLLEIHQHFRRDLVHI